MKKWIAAESFKEQLVERGITASRFSKDAGLCRTTVQKWFARGEVPLVAMTTLKALYGHEQGEFQALLKKTGRTMEWFCTKTGTPHAAATQWQRTNSVPQWAIFVIKQQFAIDGLKHRVANLKADTANDTQTTP